MGEGSGHADAKAACGEGRGEHAYVDLREVKYQGKSFAETDMGKAEQAAIDARKQAIRNKPEGAGVRCRRERAEAPLTGLALSGGGIRSAAFNLGALQALEACSGLDGIDYLSTVSGGGYIGCSLTAGLAASKQDAVFPFISEDPTFFDDTPAVRHIRDYSNYLMPRGVSDLMISIGIILRGLLANVIIVAPFLFLCAGLTLLIFPSVESFRHLAIFPPPLEAWIFGEPDENAGGFRITPVLALLNIAFLFSWAVWSRFRRGVLFASDAVDGPGSKGVFVEISRWLFVITAIGVAFDIQMLLLQLAAGPLPSKSGGTATDASEWLSSIVAFFKNASLFLAPLGAVLAFFSKYLTEVAANAARSPTWTALFKWLSAKAGLWIAALVIPFLLGVLYLALIWQGLAPPAGGYLFSWPPGLAPAWQYLAAACLTAVLALLIDPNVTSLHRLYRERLSKAFLFDPDRSYLFDSRGARIPDRDLQALRPKLSRIDTSRCPYPIVNASLNLVGSRFANRRGRNADFFVFTPEFVGSDATGYVGSTTIESQKKILGEGLKETGFDLGAAMAISGAAISPNMGSATVRPLVFTLAFLNIRLGFWLRNPCSFAPPSNAPGLGDEFKDLWARFMDVAPIRLIREMFSQIDETSRTIYLTDGGNLENLGLHELLRRRCKLIIVFDAEEDATMSFPSLLRLERYARIDFGAIIKLPWESVADHCRSISGAFTKAKADGSPVPCTTGPHCAVGEIHYGGKEEDKGILVYFKSSLSGDEEDYILDYKRRYPAFPHESTGDQFFSEEQFEAYRALGFHIVKGFFTKDTPFAVCPERNETKDAARKRVRAQVLAALKSPVAEINAVRTE